MGALGGLGYFTARHDLISINFFTHAQRRRQDVSQDAPFDWSTFSVLDSELKNM